MIQITLPGVISSSLNPTTALPLSFDQNRRSALPYFLGEGSRRILETHFTDVHSRRDHSLMPSRNVCLSVEPLVYAQLVWGI